MGYVASPSGMTSLAYMVFLQVFKKVEKQLPQLTTLDLQYVSPSLLKARNLDLAVPGKPGLRGRSQF
jgi:phosphatidylinositol kinase/protein kinase (PI-3  family)